MKHATRFTLLTFAVCVTMIFLATPRAHADSGCDTSSLGSPYGSATLTLTAPHVDNAAWVSVMDVSVPRSWQMAPDLLQDPTSDSFQQAYSCLFGNPPFEYSVSAHLDQGYVRMHISGRGPIDDWFAYVPPPWNFAIGQNDFSFPFSFSQDATSIDWTAITAITQGFRITNPKPLPASEPSDSTVIWHPSTGKQAALVAFSLIPKRMLRIALTSQTGGLGQYIPLDTEKVIFPLVFVALLGIRRKNKISQGSEAQQPTKTDPAVGIATTTRRLCYAVAAFSAIQVAVDIISQAEPYSPWTYSIENIAQLLVIYAIGITVLWPYLRVIRRPLAIAVAVLIGLCFTASLPAEVYRYGTSFASSQALTHFVLSTQLLRSMQFCSSFFSWAVILEGLMAFRGALSGRTDRSLWPLPTAAALGVLSLLGTSPKLPPTGVFPSVYLPYLAGYLIAFCALLIVARRKRAVPLLPESRDQWLLALIVGYGMLLTGPQWYLGFHIGLVAVLGVVATLIVLKVSSRHSLIQLAGGRKHQQVEPASKVLAGKSSDDLRGMQQDLFAAEERLGKVTKDLSVLQGTPLVTPEQLARREWLEKEEKKLRCWPTVESQAEANQQGGLGSRMRSLFRLPEEAGIPFPEPAGPADMALALGPACEPAGNLRRALRPALILTVLPISYFAWQQNLTNIASRESPAYYIPLIEYIAGELTFWLLPPLVLMVAWSLFAGRRGSERSLQAWLFVAGPMLVHVFFNQVFEQSATLTAVLRAAILLVVMLILGVWMDLSTLQDYRHNVTSFRLFQGYLRLNRVIAAVTLILPLATAGLTIWNQINSGVLHQKVSPSQNSVSTPSPAPSPSPSSSGARQSHVAKTATARRTARPH